MTRDLVIVGGGPAGLSTALHLLDRCPDFAGRMVVLEKARYPRDKYCAGAIGRRALTLLERLGLRVEVPRVTINALSLGMAGERWTVHEPDMGIVVRRIEFDHALAREAIRRGIEVRDGTAVLGVEAMERGVRVRIAGGAIEAKAVVGADGVAGVVRRSAGFARATLRAQVIEVDTEIVAGDPPEDTLHFDFASADLNGYAWDFPTIVDGQRKVCRGIYRIVDHDHDDVHERLRGFLARKGLDMSRYRLKPFAEHGFEFGAAVSKPRILLVGEAAGVDIATGEGIAQAIQYGKAAGEFLARAFREEDFSFAEWGDWIRAADVGRELRHRLWCHRAFYGRQRPTVERLVRTSPSAVRIGIREFAGRPSGVDGWARAARELAPAVAKLGAGVVLRALRAGAARADPRR
jgi:flavin-dependent dehydrogenase